MRLSDQTVIEILYELSEGDSNQSEICKKYNRTFAAINKSVKYLLSVGLVEKKTSLKSKRVRIIGLTKKARDSNIPKIMFDLVKLEREINNDKRNAKRSQN